MIAALCFTPLPLYLARRADPVLSRTPLVHVEDGRVLHANALARRHGISAGMLLDGARLRVEGLRVVSIPEPDLEHGWRELLGELHAITPWVEGARRGLAFVEVAATEAVQLAHRFDVSVGVARNCELAELAALATSPGACRKIAPTTAAETAFLARLPLRFLKGVALSARNLTRLEWLGINTAADLAAWTKPQLSSYLGEEGSALIAYLHGPRRDVLRPFSLPETLARSLAFSRPVREPRQLIPALDKLSSELERALDGRASHRLTLTTALGVGQLRASRLSKRPLAQARHIRQQALFALRDSGVAGQHIERLTIELSDPQRAAQQDGLWPQRERRQRALEATFERFPHAPRRLEWRDPHTQADDLAWSWQAYSDSLEPGATHPAIAIRRPPRPGTRASRAAVPSSLRAAVTAVPLFEPPTPDADTTQLPVTRPHATTTDPRGGDIDTATDPRHRELGSPGSGPVSTPTSPLAAPST